MLELNTLYSAQTSHNFPSARMPSIPQDAKLDQFSKAGHPPRFIPHFASGMKLSHFVISVLEKEILPLYKTPYPYQIGNRFIQLDKLPVKRPIHGCMHIVRSILLAEILMSIYVNLLGVDPAKFDRFAIWHAIAFHDSARNGDGIDIWEKDSAALAKRKLEDIYQPANGDECVYLEYVSQIIDKEYSNEHLQEDINALIVHAVDTIEILRVRDIADFDYALLHFLSSKDPVLSEISTHSMDVEQIRKELVHDAGLLIEKTDQFENKKNLEQSDRYFQEFISQFMALMPKFNFIGKVGDFKEIFNFN